MIVYRGRKMIMVQKVIKRLTTREVYRNRFFCNRSIHGSVKKRDWPKANRFVLFCSLSPCAKFYLDL